MVDLGSGEVTYVTDGDDPAWSPDGTTLAFSGVGDADTRLLTIQPGGEATVIATGSEPTWSPDGERVAFVRFD